MQPPPQEDQTTLNYTATLACGAVAASVVAFTLLGWFGVGLVGLVGLWYVNDFRMVRSDDHGDIAYPDYRRTPYSDWIHERARENYRQQLVAEGRRQEDIAAERAHLRYLKNTIFLALMGLGLGMSMIHG